ncbi:MAG: phosphate ABC transporter permease PstA [Planctomycetota bacterium]|nr:phosphate ABC transporter permease PstA [Planctomycetota bacterium]
MLMKQGQPKGVLRRRSSLFARGEPMVWLTGGSLTLCLLMIVGLLVLVFARGCSTFVVAPITQIETKDGKVYLGEITREDTFEPGPEVLEALEKEQGKAAVDKIKANEGQVTRRLMRTGNFEYSGEHFHWVTDFDIAKESTPEWAVVVERHAREEASGRFYGEPVAFRIDGEVVAEGNEAAWKKFLELHPEILERREERLGIEENELGDIRDRRGEGRLELRRVELDHGKDSEQYRQQQARQTEINKKIDEDKLAIDEKIRKLIEENERYQIDFEITQRDQPVSLYLTDIVRAYPANQLTSGEKREVYLSRWGEFLLDEPREANQEGGVYPAIFGTVIMTLIMCILVVPFGVLAALYLREYAKQGTLVSIVRIAVNNLAGVPSIVFGVFGLGFFCYIVGANIDELFYAEKLPNPTFGKGGIMWASFTLALLTLPVVIVATEEALAAVPNSMREGSYACGASKWQTIQRIVLPRAMPGVITGMILAVARGAGEVAPLMLVGAVKLAPELPVDGTFPFIHGERSFMHLGFHIFDVGFQSPNAEAAKPMVFTTTLLLIFIVVSLNLVGIWVRGRLRKQFVGT